MILSVITQESSIVKFIFKNHPCCILASLMHIQRLKKILKVKCCCYNIFGLMTFGQYGPWNLFPWPTIFNKQVLSKPLKLKVFKVEPENCQKISSRIFHRKTYYTWFQEFSYNILSGIVWKNTFLTLTQPRPLGIYVLCRYSRPLLLLKLIYIYSN